MADSTTTTHTYKFNISMSCGGCSGAVDRVLKKLEGMLSLFPSPLLRDRSYYGTWSRLT